MLALVLAAVALPAFAAAGPAFAADGGSVDDAAPAEEPSFDVEITATEADLPEPTEPPTAASLTVAYTVENTGEAAGTQDVTLAIEGFDVTSATVSLDAGESVDDAFELDGTDLAPVLGGEPAIEFTVTVSSENDTDEATVGVGSEGTLEVTGLTTPDTVAGEPLEVTAALTNTGDAFQTQLVEFEAGGLGEASTPVALPPNGSTERTVSFPTAQGDADTYTVTAATEDDNASTEATVLPGDGDNESFFAVDIENVTLETPELFADSLPDLGLAVEYTVENTGNASDTQDLALTVEGLPIASETVTLTPGETANKTFELGSVPDAATDGTAEDVFNIEFTIAVSSADDTDEETVVIGPEGPEFEVTGLTVDDVVEGETAEVTAEVTNTGDLIGLQTVTVDAAALGAGSKIVPLMPGDSAERTVSIPTESGDAGEYTVTAATDDDEASTTLTVLPEGGPGEESFFGVNITETELELPDSPEPPLNASLTVAYTVENTGNASDTQAVNLSIEGFEVATEMVTLAPGDSVAETFEFDTADLPDLPLDGGTTEFTVAVSSEDDTDEATVAVDPPEAVFEVTGLTAETVVAGEDIDVELEVTNTGDAEGTQNVTVDVGAWSTASLTLSLAPGESAQQTVLFPSGEDDAGEYTVVAATEDDEASTGLTVLPGDGDNESFFAVNITETEVELPDSGSALETELTVAYTVENTGNASDTQNVTLAVDDETVDTETVALAPGESAAETVELDGEDLPLDGGTTEFDVTVSSENDTDAETVTVSPGEAVFEVTELTVDDVVAGSGLNVGIGVTNTGDAEGTQEVDIDIGELGGGSLSLSLAAGEQVEQTASFQTEPGDEGNYTVTVSTDDDEASTEVTVLPGDGGNESVFAVEITEAEAELSPSPPFEAELTVEYTVENTGDAPDTQAISLSIEGESVDSQDLSLDPGESAEETFEYESPSLPSDVGPDVTLNLTVASEDDSDEATVEIDPLGEPPALVGSPVQDLNGDGLYQDVTGDGVVDIFDVQTLFTHLDTPAVQNHAPMFDFDGSGDADIFDVQTLFDGL